MEKSRLILASSSPRRLALLKDIGVTPDRVMAANIEETPQPQERPRELAKRLSTEKLQAIAKQEQGAFILAADTVVGVGRRILPKAETDEDVRACLKLMSGRRHHVYTGVALINPSGKISQRIVGSSVIFNQMTDKDCDDYVACGEGVGKAGGYAVQGKAASYIRFISGSYSSIVGLPLFETAQLLRSSGFPL